MIDYWLLTIKTTNYGLSQKNGGFRCFNLTLLNSHGMQIM